MRYIWVTFSILIIWVAAIVLILYNRIPNPQTFFLFTVAATVILSGIGFKSA